MFKVFKKFSTFQLKLFVVFMVISLLPMYLILNVVLTTTQNFFVEQQKVDYMQEASIISNYISQEEFLKSNNKKIQYLNQYILNRSSSEGYRILVSDSEGKIIADSSETANNKKFVMKEITNALEGESVTEFHKDENALYVSSPVIDKYTSEVVGVVLIVGSVDKIELLLNEVGKNLNDYVAIILLILFTAIFFTIKAILNPLNKIMNVIEKMAKGQFNERIMLKHTSDFYELAEAFNDMADKIQAVEQARDEFVSNVSHELKTPLSSIKVLSDSLLLQENAPKEMYVEFLEDIVSETDRLAMIVNDLLTLVKLDQSNIVLNIEMTFMGDLVQKIIKRLNPLALKKNITIQFNMERDFEAEIDRIKIDLAIANLIVNAIKYTPIDGLVKIQVYRDQNDAYIIVEDTGIGIDKDELGNIFTRFYRIDKTRDRETGGSGLGLSITYSTILLHNGDVKVTSEVGLGSKFIVILPIRYSKEM